MEAFSTDNMHWDTRKSVQAAEAVEQRRGLQLTFLGTILCKTAFPSQPSNKTSVYLSS